GDHAVRTGEVRDPHVVVAVDDDGPRTGQATAGERRPRKGAAIGSQQRDAAVAALLVVHDAGELRVGIATSLQLQTDSAEREQAMRRAAEPIRDPHVAEAIDREPASAVPGFELLRLRRVRRGEARDEVTTRVRDPDPILLIDSEMERSAEIFARR